MCWLLVDQTGTDLQEVLSVREEQQQVLLLQEDLLLVSLLAVRDATFYSEDKIDKKDLSTGR